MGGESLGIYEDERLRDFERCWPALECLDAPEIIADTVIGTCATDLKNSHPEVLWLGKKPPREDVVVRGIFSDEANLLFSRRFTREERVMLRVLESLGVRQMRRKFPGSRSDVLSLTDVSNWKKFRARLDMEEAAYLAQLVRFWSPTLESKPGDGTLVGIGGKPQTDRIVETLGTVLVSEISEELNLGVETVARDLVVPIHGDAYFEMGEMIRLGQDRYIVLNEALKEGLVSMRGRLLGVTLMYVENKSGDVGRILYVVNAYQEGNTPSTGSYSYHAIQGVLVRVATERIVADYPNLGPELAGTVESESRQILMKAIAGEGWFTRMVRVDSKGRMCPGHERMQLITSAT